MNPRFSLRDRALRLLFGVASRAGSAAHAGVCAAYFGIKYRTPDPWGYDSRGYERDKYEATLRLANDRAWTAALEVGCGEGAFTRMLAERQPARDVVAVDISSRAIRRARERCRGLPRARFVCDDAFRAPPSGAFDLIVCAELLYYGGTRVASLANALGAALLSGGRMILVHPWPESDTLHAPFRTLSGMSVLHERVERDPERPYAMTVIGRT